MDKYNVYEVYLCDPATGRAGWDIEFIAAPSAKHLETMPDFDCVILRQYTGLTYADAKVSSNYCSGKVWDGKKFI